MATLDTVAGTVDNAVTYHYDVGNDVLYLRRTDHPADAETLGEETDGGLIELREEETGELVGVTVVNWWKRYGDTSGVDSLRALRTGVERMADALMPSLAGA